VTVRLEDLPLAWFDRPAYAPRLADPGAAGESGESWFALALPQLSVREIDSISSADLERASAHTDRRALAAALAATYRDWALPLAPEAARNLEALGEPTAAGAACVVTGQQPGFLGGPLFTLYKALSAIAAAAAIERRLGHRCVPVFWVAGEDHDLEEVRTARFPAGGGREIEFLLPHRAERRPLSTLAVDAATETVLDAAAGHFAPRRHGAEVAHWIDLYRGRTVASGFAALVAAILGEHGLVVLDPEKLRPLARPLVRRLIEAPGEALERIEEGTRSLAALGLRPFVTPRLPLFLLRDGRRDHLSPAPGGLAIDGGGPVIERAALLALLEDAPERFSSGALLRPLVQAYALPCVLTVGGPAEVGYHAQLEPLSRWLRLAPPRIALRLQATVVDGKAAKAWRKLGLDGARFARARAAEDLVAAGDSPAAGAALARLAELREAATRTFDALPSEVPAAARELARGARRITEALERLSRRVEHAARRGDHERFDAARAVWDAAFPAGELQERRWGYLHHTAKHGATWIGELLALLCGAPLAAAHRLVWIEPHD
jgi:bacillithiol biosynthesis cysteine-adding enzyme BshC